MTKIQQVRAYQPATPDAPQDWRTQLGQIVVEVETDDGQVGVGVGGGGQAAIHVIQTVLQDCLIGRSPLEVEQIHADLCRHTAFYGRKGIVVMAISGVDLALWDVRGKIENESVVRRLAPQLELPRLLPTYITAFGETAVDEAIAAGHGAIKLHVENLADVSQIAAAFERTRRRAGPDVELMVDAFGTWDVERTLRIAEALAPFNLLWIEEPLPPDDLAGYEILADRSPVAIAGGEHEYLIDGFRTLITRGLHAVLQPDVNWCGGLTTLIQIYQEAQAAGIRVCPHRGCEPFALPAIAALDQNPLAESGRSWFQVWTNAPSIQHGRISVSAERPGFGLEGADE